MNTKTRQKKTQNTKKTNKMGMDKVNIAYTNTQKQYIKNAT